MRDKAAVLEAVRSVIETSCVDVTDLVVQLGITIEDVMDRFPDKMLLNAETFLVGFQPIVDEDENDDEENIYDPFNEEDTES